MYTLDEEILAKYSAQYPRSSLKDETEILYGTAGFRRKATDLPHIVFRMGILAGIRSQYCGAAIGLMLTASHNPVCDNGIKLIDPHGEMLEFAWERYASRLANADDASLKSVLHRLIEEISNLQTSGSHGAKHQTTTSNVSLAERKPVVLLGRDTRPSSVSLSETAIAGAACLKSHTVDFGLVTTPILHYIVRCTNDAAVSRPVPQPEDSRFHSLRYESTYGEATAEGYYEKLSHNFKNLLGLFGVTRNERAALTVDCANGIGYQHLLALSERIPHELLHVHPINIGDGELNARCGADFVKIERKFPANVDLNSPNGSGRLASLDGDADRIVYFYAASDTGACCLLDGDKIALLFTRFLVKLLRDAQPHAKLSLGAAPSQPTDSEEPLNISIGVVQTAYANGSSTSAILSVGCGVETSCVPTGVKHLHAKAIEYDVGVFFEANGHGTVLFSDRLKQRLRDSLRRNYSIEVDRLLTAINLINETVGDSLSDLLTIEAILAIESMSISDWDALYTDLPSRQLKVTVPDRTRVRTTYDERRVVEPEALQAEIDRLVDLVQRGSFADAAVGSCARSFVRPSGTEDVVRVYAEATLQSTADALAERVGDAVRQVLASK